MMKKFVFLFAFFAAFPSCEKPHPYPRFILETKPEKIVVVNTKKMANCHRYSYDITEQFEDSIGSKITQIPYDSIPAKPDLRIVIDTSYVFYAKGFEYQRHDFPFDKSPISKIEAERIYDRFSASIDRLKETHICAFPVLIYNKSAGDALITDYRIIQEALDVDGKWKPIEFWHTVGSDIIDQTKEVMIISSNHCFGSAAIKYHGPFKTKIRIKCRVNNEYVFYSEPVVGSINREQFDTEFMDSYQRFSPAFVEGDVGDFRDYVLLNKY